jgi:hypothetical protein
MQGEDKRKSFGMLSLFDGGQIFPLFLPSCKRPYVQRENSVTMPVLSN